MAHEIGGPRLPNNSKSLYLGIRFLCQVPIGTSLLDLAEICMVAPFQSYAHESTLIGQTLAVGCE